MPRVYASMSATFQPYAECMEGIDADGTPIEGEAVCGRAWGAASWTRADAKEHAKLTGHPVRVVVERIDVYRRQD